MGAVAAERNRGRREDIVGGVVEELVNHGKLSVGADAKTPEGVLKRRRRLTKRCRHQLVNFPAMPRSQRRVASDHVRRKRYVCVASIHWTEMRKEDRDWGKRWYQCGAQYPTEDSTAAWVRLNGQCERHGHSIARYEVEMFASRTFHSCLAHGTMHSTTPALNRTNWVEFYHFRNIHQTRARSFEIGSSAAVTGFSGGCPLVTVANATVCIPSTQLVYILNSPRRVQRLQLV